MFRKSYEFKAEELLEEAVSELPESKQSSNDGLFEMNPEFIEADQENYPGEYLLTEGQREGFEVYISKGKLYDVLGLPFSNENCIYVLSEDNTLYAYPNGGWKHSFFLAGGRVKAAGFIRTDKEGYIQVISNESGHYTPATDKMLPALKFFSKQLADVKDRPVIYEKHDEAPYPTRKVKFFELSKIILHLENILAGDESNEEDLILKVINLPNNSENPEPKATPLVDDENDVIVVDNIMESKNVIDVENVLAKNSLFSPRRIITKSASYDSPKTKTYDSDGYDEKSPASILSPKISEDGFADSQTINFDDDEYDNGPLDIQATLASVTSIFRSGSHYGAAPRKNLITKSVSLDGVNDRENVSPDLLAESFIALNPFGIKKAGPNS